jgi:hypothetical protein
VLEEAVDALGLLPAEFQPGTAQHRLDLRHRHLHQLRAAVRDREIDVVGVSFGGEGSDRPESRGRAAVFAGGIGGAVEPTRAPAARGRGVLDAMRDALRRRSPQCARHGGRRDRGAHDGPCVLSSSARATFWNLPSSFLALA